MTDDTKQAGESYGFSHDEEPAVTFKCQCGSNRFTTSFVLGKPIGTMYALRHTCVACDKVYTAEQVSVALDQL